MFGGGGELKGEEIKKETRLRAAEGNNAAADDDDGSVEKEGITGKDVTN